MAYSKDVSDEKKSYQDLKDALLDSLGSNAGSTYGAFNGPAQTHIMILHGNWSS